MDKKLEELAKEARRAYQREWRAKNPDKAKRNTENYWLRKAQQMIQEQDSTKAGSR